MGPDQQWREHRCGGLLLGRRGRARRGALELSQVGKPQLLRL